MDWEDMIAEPGMGSSVGQVWGEDLSKGYRDDDNSNEHIGESQQCQQPRRHQFRRPRAGRACGSCHSRRIRCDAGSHGIPCTNCTAHSTECAIPPKKKRKSERATAGEMMLHRQRSTSTRTQEPDASSPAPELDLSPSIQISHNLRSLEDKWRFTGLYAEIAKQNAVNAANKSAMRRKIDSAGGEVEAVQYTLDWKQPKIFEEGLRFSEEDEKRTWMDSGGVKELAFTHIAVREW